MASGQPGNPFLCPDAAETLGIGRSMVALSKNNVVFCPLVQMHSLSFPKHACRREKVSCMSPSLYRGTMLLQSVQGRLFLTISLWWASLHPGDVVTGRVVPVPPSAQRGGRSSFHITKTYRVSEQREQSEWELSTLHVQDQSVVLLAIYRQQVQVATARYRIDASTMSCIDETAETEGGDVPMDLTMQTRIFDQPYRGLLLVDRQKAPLVVGIYLWWEALFLDDVVWIETRHFSNLRIRKTAFLDGGREQSMQELQTLTIEEDEAVHVTIGSETGETDLAYMGFTINAQSGQIDFRPGENWPRELQFEVLQPGDAGTYTGKVRYRLCECAGRRGFFDLLFEQEEEARLACTQKGYGSDQVLSEYQTRWHTWELRHP